MGNWYTVKGIFRWYFKENNETELFEERIILVNAKNFDDALDKAENEAAEYCQEDPKANFKIESLKKFYAYEILEKELEAGIELFSNRRKIPLDSDSYLKRFYPETLVESANKTDARDRKNLRGSS